GVSWHDHAGPAQRHSADAIRRPAAGLAGGPEVAVNILYVGDVMAETGLRAGGKALSAIRQEKAFDLGVTQAENVTEGRGITPADFKRLRAAGVDFCTGGNWSLYHEAIAPALTDPQQPIIRPANYPEGTPGLGYKYIEAHGDRVLVVSLLGHIV